MRTQPAERARTLLRDTHNRPVPHPRALPDRIRVAAHHRVLARGPGARQVGLDALRGQVWEDLCPASAAMLDELGSAAQRTVALVERAIGRGADPDGVVEILRGLVAAGLVVDAGLADRAARRRADSQVVVRGRGPLAVGVSAGLAVAGVGRLHVRTSGPVGPDDLAAGLPAAALGRDRADAVAELLAGPSRCGSAGVGPVAAPVRVPADLVVLTDVDARYSAGSRQLTAAATEHLLVRVRDGRGVVGPLVLPGRSACLGCLERYRTDRDPGWPLLAAADAEHAGTADPAVLVATAALGVAQALRALDGPAVGAPAPPALGATLEIDLDAGTVDARSWAGHGGCLCGAATPDPGTAADAPCEPARRRETIGG